MIQKIFRAGYSLRLREYECVHDNEVACASAHHEEMENLVASEVFVLTVKDRYLQRVYDASRRIDETAC